MLLRTFPSQGGLHSELFTVTLFSRSCPFSVSFSHRCQCCFARRSVCLLVLMSGGRLEFEGSMSSHWSGEWMPSLQPNASLGKAVAAQYAPQRHDFADSAPAAYVSADADYSVLCPALQLASAMGKLRNAQTFVYVFFCTVRPAALPPLPKSLQL